MNQHPGVVGRKIGMTQVFTDDGSVIPCTVIQSKSVVVGKRTQEKDGYDALVLGDGERKEKHTSKPLAGYYKKQNVAPKRVLRELRGPAEWVAKFDIGQELKLDEVFSEGQFVDVQGMSKGRGFTGVMKRHNFKGQRNTHGTHEYKRHGGAIGTNMTPGRTLPGLKMPGHHGAAQITVLSQRIEKIVADQGLVLVRGGVPGAKDTIVVVRGAVKKKGGLPKSA